MKRIKEEMAQAVANYTAISSLNNNSNQTEDTNPSDDTTIVNIKQEPQQIQDIKPQSTTICLPEVTIHVSSSYFVLNILK